MEKLIEPVMVLLILSLITEKLANLIKLQNDSLAIKRREYFDEKKREGYIQWVTIGVGVLIAFVCKANFFDLFKNDYELFWPTDLGTINNWPSNIVGAFITGLFLSLGSKFFHDLLDILLQIKNLKRKLNDRANWEFNNIQQVDQYINTNDAKLAEATAQSYIETISKIDKVLSVYMELDSNKPTIHVLVAEDFDKQNLIPAKIPYTNSNNNASFIDVQIQTGHTPITHKTMFPGHSIRNHSTPGNNGSYGGLIYDQTTNEAFFTSCYHVVKSPTHLWHDFEADGTETIINNHAQEVCGTIHNAVRDHEVDFAIMKVANNYKIDGSINGIGIPYFSRRFNPNDKVYRTKVKMYGMVSKFSIGTLADFGRQVSIDYSGHNHIFNDIIVIKALNKATFSLPGDSGSYVLDEYNYLIGVLVGGTGNISFVIPIDNINSKFKTKIHTL